MPTQHTPNPVAPLVFVHIPKAAGTSLKELIARVYRSSPALFFTPGDGLLDRFRAMPPEKRATCAVLGGHAPFGMQSAYDGAVRADGTPVRPAVITVLREPVARVCSLYRYIFREPAHTKHAEFVIKRPTIAQVYDEAKRGDGFVPFDNHQVRYLAGSEALAKPFGSLTRADLETAMSNLETGCRAFGIQERMDESLSLFERELHWPHSKLTNLNASPATDAAPPIRDADRAAIEASSTLDTELYAFATELFERRIGAARP